MSQIQGVTPFLWFDSQAEAAVDYYVSLFPDSRKLTVTNYPESISGDNPQVMTVSCVIKGTDFVALNGGNRFAFTPAISFVISCDTQEEIDVLWESLSENGDPQMCGWVTDRFGVTWQIIPRNLPQLLSAGGPEKSAETVQKMFSMTKIIIADLQ